LPSLPHLNVIGSLITGSHGGAPGLGELATMVKYMEIIDY